MTYLISGLGADAAFDPIAFATSVFNGKGDGSAFNPFGGIFGGTEADLKRLAKGGIRFKSPAGFSGGKVETTLVPPRTGERTITFLGKQDGKLYKFAMTGTGLLNQPSDQVVKDWASGIVAANAPAVVDPAFLGPLGGTGSSISPLLIGGVALAVILLASRR